MSPPTVRSTIDRLIAELDKSIPLDLLPPIATTKQVAKAIGATESSLNQERYLGKGISYTKIGRRVRYLRSDVIEFLAANRVEGAA